MDEKKANASLSASLWFTCPLCKEEYDLLDLDALNDEGTVSKIVFSSDWENTNYEFECPVCCGDVILGSVVW